VTPAEPPIAAVPPPAGLEQLLISATKPSEPTQRVMFFDMDEPARIATPGF
jgi:hypothetical protein